MLDTLNEKQQELIKKHLELVIEANEKTNLTRIETPEEALLLHVEDSLSGLNELNKAPDGPYGDLGSGAGYPGVPLAIATGRPTTLIDARQKKMLVLDGIIEKLGLSDQIKTFANRAELLARKEPTSFSVLSARALAKLSVLMELASPLLVSKGHLICYKAQLDDSELAHAKEVQKATGMKLLSVREFQLGDEYSRTIVVFEKIAKPAISLPRQEGQAQKNPL